MQTLRKTAKATTGKRKVNLSDIPKRMSAKEFQSKLLSSREESWRLPPFTEKVLKYQVEFKVEESQEDFVKNHLSGTHMLNLNNKFSGKVSVIHAGETTRVNCIGTSVLGSNYSVVKQNVQGSLYLDHGTKSFLRIPKELEARHGFSERFSATVKVEKAGKGTVVKAVIGITSPYQIRYELWLDTSKEYTAHRKDILCNSIGCPEVFAASGIDLSPILNTGIPVKGEVYMPADSKDFELISSFSVSGFQWTKYEAKDFSVPSGYKSLKELSKDAKLKEKRSKFAPTVRLSDVRARKGKASFNEGMADMGATFPNFPNGANATSPAGPDLQRAGKFEGGGLKFPTCFDETYASLIANVVDQKLLDDVKYLANGITKRLTSFAGNNGNITINWMDQFKAHSDALADVDPGGGLYLIMHDETPMGAGNPMKKGLLDKLAVKDLGNLLSDGNNLSDLSLPAAVQTRVNNVIANTGIAPANRFSSLTLEDQGALIDAYVFKKIGTIKLTYPSSTGTKKVFHGLLEVRLDNIEFDIAINNTSVIDTLSFDSNSVHLILKLPTASGKAFMSRWPAPLYWAIVAASGLACIFFPPACTLAAAAILVGIFVGLDFSFVSLELSNIEIDAHLTWVPNGSNVLEPQVSLTLDADVDVFYMSVVPTGIHQILSLLYMIVLNNTDIIIDEIESQLQDKLNDFLKKDLEITYPPKFGPVPLIGINNNTEFVDTDRMYVEQGLNSGTLGVICPYITQVDAEVKSKVLKLRDDFKATFEDPVAAFTRLGLINWTSADFSTIARYYAGTVLSQNFINHYIYTLWRTGAFNYDFSTDETESLFNLLKIAFPQFRSVEFNPRLVKAHLWPAVPPRTVFTPKPASEGKYYSTTFFDDVRICFEFGKVAGRKPNKLELLFAAQTFTEIGFGALNTSTSQLDILKMADRVFDIYFDLKNLGVSVIHPEIESFRIPGMVVSVAQDYSPLDAGELQKMLRLAMRFALASRNAVCIPRGPGDSAYLQRYPLGDDALKLVCQLVPFQGNLYVSKGLSGMATAVYEGALDIDTLNKTFALLIRAFS